jgi:hypothetical protein
MAELFDADLFPSKLDIADRWLAGRPWRRGDPDVGVTKVASFRFDDPAGRVGVETHLLRVGTSGPIHVLPMTYRDAPMPGGGLALMSEMEHSVLGHRWVYDGTRDPVWVEEMVRCALSGGTGAEEMFRAADGTLGLLAPSMTVLGSGSGSGPIPAAGGLGVTVRGAACTITGPGYELTLAHVLDGSVTLPPGDTITGTWVGGRAPFASVVRR